MKKSPCFVIAALVILSDQITKYLARTYIHPFETVRVLPFFHLVSVRNRGAAFGLFKSFGNNAFIIVSIIAITVVSYLLVTRKEDRLGLSLILGGAAGNLIDRIIFGNVTDFIDVFAGSLHWPAFNIADSALTVGLVVLLVNSFFQHRHSHEQAVDTRA